MNIQTLSYKELVAEATTKGLQKASQTKKEDLIKFLTGLTAQKREKKPVDPRIIEMADGSLTTRQIAKELGVKYSDVYFALKKAGLTAKPVKKKN
jgi:DNA invertase Pin-like site-specific DNA recombinase